MTARQRNSVVIGVTFLVTGILYGVLAPVFDYNVEFAGVTMLVALGVALGIMSYVLTSGSND